MNNFKSLCAANSRIRLLELLIVSLFLSEGFWSFTVNYELANNVYYMYTIGLAALPPTAYLRHGTSRNSLFLREVLFKGMNFSKSSSI